MEQRFRRASVEETQALLYWQHWQSPCFTLPAQQLYTRRENAVVTSFTVDPSKAAATTPNVAVLWPSDDKTLATHPILNGTLAPDAQAGRGAAQEYNWAMYDPSWNYNSATSYDRTRNPPGKYYLYVNYIQRMTAAEDARIVARWAPLRVGGVWRPGDRLRRGFPAMSPVGYQCAQPACFRPPLTTTQRAQ